MTDSEIKRTTQFLYDSIGDAVETYPGASAIAIARELVDKLTPGERLVILEQLVSHRVQVAQQVRSHARHLVSVRDE